MFSLSLRFISEFPRALTWMGILLVRHGLCQWHNSLSQYLPNFVKGGWSHRWRLQPCLGLIFLTLSLTKPIISAWQALVMQHAILVSLPDQSPRGLEPRPVTCIYNALSMSHRCRPYFDRREPWASDSSRRGKLGERSRALPCCDVMVKHCVTTIPSLTGVSKVSFSFLTCCQPPSA